MQENIQQWTTPKILLIIVQKRHNARFYKADSGSSKSSDGMATPRLDL